MTLSVNSLFTYLKVAHNIGPSRITSVVYATTEDDREEIYLSTNPADILTTEQRTNLGILHNIYKVNGFFPDIDGNELENVTWAGRRSYEDMVSAFFNPFDVNQVDEQRLGRAKQLFRYEAEIERDNATGKTSATIKGDVTVGDSTPDGSVDHGLASWEVDYIGNNIFKMQLYVTSIVNDDEETMLTEAAVDDVLDIKALLSWLQSELFSGPDIGDEFNVDATYDGTKFQVTAGGATVQFEEYPANSSRIFYYVGSATRIQFLEVLFRRPADQTLDWDTVNWETFRNFVREQTGSISGDDSQENRINKPTRDVYGKSLKSVDTEIILAGGLVFRKDALGTISMGPGHSRVVYLDELEQDDDDNFLLPAQRDDFTHIHCREHSSLSGLQKLKIGRPRDVLPFTDNSWEFMIHNKSGLLGG